MEAAKKSVEVEITVVNQEPVNNNGLNRRDRVKPLDLNGSQQISSPASEISNSIKRLNLSSPPISPLLKKQPNNFPKMRCLTQFDEFGVPFSPRPYNVVMQNQNRQEEEEEFASRENAYPNFVVDRETGSIYYKDENGALHVSKDMWVVGENYQLLAGPPEKLAIAKATGNLEYGFAPTAENFQTDEEMSFDFERRGRNRCYSENEKNQKDEENEANEDSGLGPDKFSFSEDLENVPEEEEGFKPALNSTPKPKWSGCKRNNEKGTIVSGETTTSRLLKKMQPKVETSTDWEMSTRL